MEGIKPNLPPEANKRCLFRIYKTKDGDYALQALDSKYVNVSFRRGDLDYIIEEHNSYTEGKPPCFIKPQNTDAT